MDLLHVLTMHEPGGLENRVCRFVNTAKSKHDHTLLVIGDKIHDMYSDRLDENATLHYWKYFNGLIKIPRFLRSWFLARWLKQKTFDAWICYSQLSYEGLLRTLFRSIDAPSIYYEGGAAWYKSTEVMELLHQFSGYVANSRASKFMLTEKFQIDSQKIELVFNGIPRENFEALKSSHHDDSNSDGENDFTIVFLGRLVPKKAANVPLRAMQYLDDNYRLRIVGDGSELSLLKQLAEELGVDNSVEFCGFQRNPGPYLRSADLMVMPSVREPMGNVLLEGGAAGLPIVAGRVDGTPDLIENGEHGVLLEPSVELDRWPSDYTEPVFPERVVCRNPMELCEPKFIDPRELAGVIKQLNADDEKRKKMGENLQRRIEEDFLMEDKISELYNFYQSKVSEYSE